MEYNITDYFNKSKSKCFFVWKLSIQIILIMMTNDVSTVENVNNK